MKRLIFIFIHNLTFTNLQILVATISQHFFLVELRSLDSFTTQWLAWKRGLVFAKRHSSFLLRAFRISLGRIFNTKAINEPPDVEVQWRGIDAQTSTGYHKILECHFIMLH